MPELHTEDFDFQLPEELIASRPAEKPKPFSRLITLKNSERTEPNGTAACIKEIQEYLRKTPPFTLD